MSTLTSVYDWLNNNNLLCNILTAALTGLVGCGWKKLFSIPGGSATTSNTRYMSLHCTINTVPTCQVVTVRLSAFLATARHVVQHNATHTNET
jgi:hypothetical protein